MMDNWQSKISPTQLIFGIILLLIVVPGVGCGFLNRVVQEGSQTRLERQQAIIQSIDEDINIGNVNRKVITESDSMIEQEFYANQELVARDVYFKNEDGKMELRTREYYSNNVVIARDLFGAVSNIPGIYIDDVVKQREYYNQDNEIFLREFFDKNGVGYPKIYLIGQNNYELRQNNMRSPFPPLIIFYR